MSAAQLATLLRQPQPGDVVFFRCRAPFPHRLPEHLVCLATGGPYCHCGVVRTLSDVTEARGEGIVRHALPADYAAVAATSRRLTAKGLGNGLAWLDRKVAAHSGYARTDIVMDGLRVALGLLLPKRLGSRTPFLVAPGRYDCSELATRFLVAAGYDGLPDALAEAPSVVSPNDLARALGLLPPLKP